MNAIKQLEILVELARANENLTLSAELVELLVPPRFQEIIIPGRYHTLTLLILLDKVISTLIAEADGIE